MRVLAINPGSTSTKIAVYDDALPIFAKSIVHTPADLKQFAKVSDQYPFRLGLIHEALADAGIPMQFDAVIGRGSLAKPVHGGVYKVSPQMVKDAFDAEHQHACDLGCVLAYDVAEKIDGCQSYTADPGVVDELCDEARISGSPHCPRVCIWHALNQRATARKFAAGIGRKYEDLNLIICHLGGGISVAAHCHGKAIDANNALDGEGPFSPERAGTLPAAALVKLCYSGRFTEDQLLKRIAGHAGLEAHLGTTDVKEILHRIENGDKKAELVIDSMIFHTAKAIAAEGAVLFGDIDAILITGGMAHSEYIIERLKRRIAYLAPVYVFPGENEMEALASNAVMALRGEIEAQDY